MIYNVTFNPGQRNYIYNYYRFTSGKSIELSNGVIRPKYNVYITHSHPRQVLGCTVRKVLKD